MRNAGDAEQFMVGWWPGDARHPGAAFYAYAYPKPPGYEDAALSPAAAHWDKNIGEFILDNLPPDLPERSPIEVVCRYSSDGRISVQGRDMTSGRLAETTLVPQGRLDDAELNEESRRIAELQIV